MNDTNIPLFSESSTLKPVFDSLLGALPEMSPQLKKAAGYILDNPQQIGVASIREIAEAADVKPNTLVRMARAAGYEGYEDFREPFRDAVRGGGGGFPDRARWLQEIARGGRYGRLYSGMAASCFDNVQELFAGTGAEEVKAAADLIVKAGRTYVLGVGVSYALAHNFAYLTSMALDNIVAVPRDGSLPIDDIAKAGPDDVVLAMTFVPYRNEVVSAVLSAKEQGAKVIGLSDSRTSPIVLAADHGFIVPTDTPQFFTSIVGLASFLETLTAFVIADAKPDVIAKIERFHDRRRKLGVYWEDE